MRFSLAFMGQQFLDIELGKGSIYGRDDERDFLAVGEHGQYDIPGDPCECAEPDEDTIEGIRVCRNCRRERKNRIGF